MKTTKLYFAGAAAICAVWLAGCATSNPAIRIRNNPEAFAQLAPPQQELVRAGRVGVGFSMDAVKLALGNPDRISLRTTDKGEIQIWHYVELAYYADEFLYPGFGGGYSRGWGRGAGWWDGGWDGDLDWGGYAVPYDHFRIEFNDGKVSSIDEEQPN